MEKITMFLMESCPYCRRALGWMDELTAENPDFKNIEIVFVDERKQPDLADKYDYFLVPTYYVGDNKVHEGAATKDIIKKVFKSAL